MAQVRAELLVTPDCPHAGRAEALLRSVLEDEEGVPSRVDRILVGDLDHAAGLSFRGSPTIRIDGADVVPADGLPVSLGCRLYRRADGAISGLPDAEAIRDALRARRERLQEERARPGLLARTREIPGRVMRAVLVWASRQSALERLALGVPVTRGMVRRFVAGEELAEVLPALERLREQGLRTTVDILGESIGSAADARAAADRYVELLRALAGRGLDGNVSLKLTQMGLDVDAAACRENVARIVDEARPHDAFVRIDMEDSSRTEATLTLARELHAGYPGVGVVIQSYLRRSAADVERLIEERIRVRLCKGAYDEPPTVAFRTKAEVDESYRALMERLLADGLYPALATHDETLIEHARRFTAERGIGADRFEFQMLYGIRRDLQEALVADGYTVRVYVPFGAEWYPYFMRRLAERPANVLFVLRSIARERRGPRHP